MSDVVNADVVFGWGGALSSTGDGASRNRLGDRGVEPSVPPRLTNSRTVGATIGECERVLCEYQRAKINPCIKGSTLQQHRLPYETKNLMNI